MKRNKLFPLQFDRFLYLIVPQIGTLSQILQLGTTNMFPIVVPYLGTKGSLCETGTNNNAINYYSFIANQLTEREQQRVSFPLHYVPFYCSLCTITLTQGNVIYMDEWILQANN